MNHEPFANRASALTTEISRHYSNLFNSQIQHIYSSVKLIYSSVKFIILMQVILARVKYPLNVMVVK